MLFSESELWYLPRLHVEDYRAPTRFPEIKYAKRIGIDLETQGLDALRGAYIVGYTIRTDDGFKEYFPVRHKGGPNCDEATVRRWLTAQLIGFEGEIVGANSNLFDGFFLQREGIVAPRARWRDVQWAEAILDEYAESYRLNDIAKKRLGQEKFSGNLVELYGENVMEHFAEVHPGHARPYALQDNDLADAVYDKQIVELQKEDLFEIFDLECRLTPLLNYMRELGTDVDLDAAEQLEKKLRTDYADACMEMLSMTGLAINPNSSDDLAKAFKQLKIEYPLTDKGNPSFKNAWLKTLKHPFADLLNKAREFEKIRSTFVEGYILNGNIRGTIHTELHPLRRADDEGERGTISGRFSSSNPNLQNIPIRTELGRQIRALFVPTFGMDWYSADFSQEEYRLLAHFAVLTKCKGADGLAKTYRENPNADFHKLVAELTGIDRLPAKTLNFGLCYGMGVNKLATSLNLVDADGQPKQEALDIMETYHKRAPFIKEIYNLASERAEQQGYIKTILGRKCRFNLFEPKRTERGQFYQPLPKEQALRVYGNNLKRAGTHKALNRLLQGSNADITKQAMVSIWESGLIKPNGPITLSLTVHDELDGSVDPSQEGRAALKQLSEMMRDAVTLQVPSVVNTGIGQNWEEAH